MKYQNVIVTLHSTLQDENVKCDVNVRIKIRKPRLFHVWLFGVNLTICKLNKCPIKFVMQSNIGQTRYLNGKIHNGREKVINVT